MTVMRYVFRLLVLSALFATAAACVSAQTGIAAVGCRGGHERLAGHYYLNGVMEVGSELLLRKDGSFEFMLAYGANDQYGKGCWAQDGSKISLIPTGRNRVSGRHTRERYLTIEKTSWNFTPRDYLFVRPQFEKDQQSLYEYQAMLTTGYGHQFFKTDKLLLTLDAGAGVRHSKDKLTRERDEDTVANTALNFEWKFRPGGRFIENASVEAGEENTIARSRTALHFAVTGVLGLFVSYDTKHDDSSATADDSLLTIGLSYQLK